MHSSTSNFDSTAVISAALPWRGITVIVVVVVIAAAAAWEVYCRSLGYHQR